MLGDLSESLLFARKSVQTFVELGLVDNDSDHHHHVKGRPMLDSALHHNQCNRCKNPGKTCNPTIPDPLDLRDRCWARFCNLIVATVIPPCDHNPVSDIAIGRLNEDAWSRYRVRITELYSNLHAHQTRLHSHTHCKIIVIHLFHHRHRLDVVITISIIII